MDKAIDIDKIFTIFAERMPLPKTELWYTNTFTLLVAVILSAHAMDKVVNKVTIDLFKKYDSPKKFLDLGEECLKSHINKIGLFNNKAKNIINISRILLERYGGEVPNNMEDLLQLPGIGRKSANVLLNVAFGQSVMPVDTHVARVAQRIGLVCTKTPHNIEKELLDVIPEKWLDRAHHWLVLHGRYTCTARMPKCSSCPINIYCKYYKSHERKVSS